MSDMKKYLCICLIQSCGAGANPKNACGIDIDDYYKKHDKYSTYMGEVIEPTYCLDANLNYPNTHTEATDISIKKSKNDVEVYCWAEVKLYSAYLKNYKQHGFLVWCDKPESFRNQRCSSIGWVDTGKFNKNGTPIQQMVEYPASETLCESILSACLAICTPMREAGR